MSNDMLEERAKQIEEIDSFTEMITKELSDITAALGWTVESITEVDDGTITCPYDPSHKICERTSEKHLIKCQWKAEGYSEEDVPLSEPSLPPGAPSSICFDENLQDSVLKAAKEKDSSMEIEDHHCYTWQGSNISCMGERLIPRTSDRIISDFTRDERLALYEYVIANTTKPELGHDIPDINKPKAQENENKEISFLELLAQERNLKRRRAKHRGVHTNKKSQTEILREVINQQMEVYAEYVCGQNDEQSNCEFPHEKSPTKDKEYTSKPVEFSNKPRPRHNDHAPEEGNGHYSSNTRDKQNYAGYTSGKDDYESRKRKWKDPYSPHMKEKSTDYKQSEYEHRSSKDRRKSHKKDRHRSEERHTKRRHRSPDRDSSSDKKHSKHKHHGKKSSRS